MLSRTTLAVTLWLAGLWIVACTNPAPTPLPVAEPTLQRVEVPVTVEVTRVVTQAIIVEATPIPPAPCAPPSLQAASAITIGAILPLSLPGNMVAGFAMQTALALAVQEINAQGGVAGHAFTLVTYDSGGRAERGRTGVERLLLDDCAAAIVGLYHNSVARTAAEASHLYGAPLIVAEATADEITAAAYPEVFRIAAPRSMLAYMPARWLAEVGDYNQDGQIMAGVIADSATSAWHTEAVMAAFAKSSIQAHLMTVDLPATDFSSAVARIVSMDSMPDALFIYLKDESALDLLSQILEAGIGPEKSTVLVLHQAGLDHAQFWHIVPDGSGTVVARIGPWPPTVTALGRQFALAYGQYTGRWPEPYAFAAYDAVFLVADAIARAQSLQGPALVAALEKSDIELAAGHYTFPFSALNPPDAADVEPYMWHQWPDVQTLYLQYTLRQQPADELPVLWPNLYRTVNAPLIR